MPIPDDSSRDDAAPAPSSIDSGEIETAIAQQEAARSMNKERRRILLLAGVVAAFMAIAHFTPLRVWITNVQEWKAIVRDQGLLASALFVIACAAAVLMGVPRLPLCLAAGLIFGFGEGLLLSLTGTSLGSYGTFLMARAGARKAVVQRASRWPWLQPLIAQPSVLRVFWVRQLMLPGIVLNVLLGVTSVRHRSFFVGTLLGYLPLNVAFTLVGSGLGKDDLAKSLTQLLAALGVVNVGAWLVWRIVNRAREAAPSASQ